MQWANNTNGIHEKLSSALCQAFLIPDKSLHVTGVPKNKSLLNISVKPPYGKTVVDSLNGSAKDAVERMQAVRKCLKDFNTNVQSIILGEFGLQIEAKLMDPKWNRKYGWPDKLGKDENFWVNSIDQGGKPYYCPSG